MSNVVPFSQSLRERTWTGHGQSEGAGFMTDLMTGKGTKEDYIALVAQHYFIYAAIEAAAETMKNDPVASAFITPKLTRLPAIETDLEFLLGADWREQITPLATTQRYVDRVNKIGSTWPGGFIAHHYTRYLGDLSGGQMIGGIIQKQFGFDTNGVGFYLFGEIADPRQFKDTYREQLDSVAWTEDEKNAVIDEVLLAYQFNSDLFLDLAEAKSAAA